MDAKVPISELNGRLQRFRARMDTGNPDWELAVIFSNINLYYFTGTMQDGMLLIPREGEPVLWVRRSFSRAGDESSFPNIQPMQSYRTAAASMGTIPKTVYLANRYPLPSTSG
jgi:Xaa-Pro aminopeptidase